MMRSCLKNMQDKGEIMKKRALGRIFKASTILLVVVLLLCSCEFFPFFGMGNEEDENAKDQLVTVLNDNVPYFSAEEKEKAQKRGYFIELSSLDDLGRVGVCWGLFDYGHMPTYDRETLNTEPTGWHQKEYDTSIVPGGWLYARAHLLAFQLSGLQDDPENLMTGTRDFNNEGMLPFENMTASHIKEERDHQVLYRVTPDFGNGDNLLAYGVTIESDCLNCDEEADYCVYIANIQPGITLDYKTGNNRLSTEEPEDEITIDEATFILNTNTKRFHRLDCSGAPATDSKNYKLTDKSYDEVRSEGYIPCSRCNPE